MTDNLPPDEALILAAKMLGWPMPDTAPVEVKRDPEYRSALIDYARLITKYEPERLKPAVDPLVEEVREIFAQEYERRHSHTDAARNFRAGNWDSTTAFEAAFACLKRGIEIGQAKSCTGWRLLEPGEALEEGDERWDDLWHIWRAVSISAHDQSPNTIYRRRCGGGEP